MPRSLTLYLGDILSASEYILRATTGMSREDYVENETIRFAVERNFMIIGEAIAQIRDYYPDAVKRIEESHKIIAFRNVLAHAYFSVDEEDVWSAVLSKLPALKREIGRFLVESQDK